MWKSTKPIGKVAGSDFQPGTKEQGCEATIGQQVVTMERPKRTASGGIEHGHEAKEERRG